VNWADLMAAQGAFGTDFYDRSILRPKHRAYYRRPVMKIGPKGALGSHDIRPIHSAPSLGQSIVLVEDGLESPPPTHRICIGRRFRCPSCRDVPSGTILQS